MKTSSDGGPAFPQLPGTFETSGHPGMSLHNYFAAAALTGMLSNPTFDWDLTADHTPEENVARRAAAIADAMLAAGRASAP